MDPEDKSLNYIFPTKHVIPKSLKFSHWLSENPPQQASSSFNHPLQLLAILMAKPNSRFILNPKAKPKKINNFIPSTTHPDRDCHEIHPLQCQWKGLECGTPEWNPGVEPLKWHGPGSTRHFTHRSLAPQTSGYVTVTWSRLTWSIPTWHASHIPPGGWLVFLEGSRESTFLEGWKIEVKKM